DGDVYADEQLLRKSLAEVREARLPVFDLAFAPPDGWGPRWLVEPSDTVETAVTQNGGLVLDAAASRGHEARLAYRHWNLDDQKEHPITAWNSYDGPARGTGPPDAAHDFS